MSDPKRWADEDAGATALEQDLFSAGRSAGMPPEEKKRIWGAIAEQASLSPIALAPAPRGTDAASVLTKGGWLKGLSTLALLAGAGAGAWAVSHRSSAGSPTAHPSDSTVHMVAAVATSSATPAVESPHPASVANELAVEAAPRPKSAPVAPGRAVAPTENSRLAEEARAVLDARAELAAGNPSAALRLLDAARADFPHGSLGQEREALTVEALAATGQRGAASARAQAFVRRFPGSPHASNVRRFIVQP
jgi:hypothetical protein